MALVRVSVRIGKACTGIKATTEKVLDAAVHHSLLISQFNCYVSKLFRYLFLTVVGNNIHSFLCEEMR